MKFVKLTRANAGMWDGAIYINAETIVSLQRTYDNLTQVCLPSSEPDGGLAGFEVSETPEEIIALIRYM